MTARHLLRKGAVAAAVAGISLSTVAASAAGSPPASPQNLALVSGYRQLVASWTESSTGSVLYVATAKAPGHRTHRCITRAKSCHIVSLNNGISYDVTVVAANSSGRSDPSSDVVGIPGVPSAPLLVHARALTDGNAFVRWAPPRSSGASAINGYVATATGGEFCTTAHARRCTISGLTAGSKYSISVVASNKYGSGPASKAVTVTAR